MSASPYSPYAPPPGWAPDPGQARPPQDAWSVVSLVTAVLGLTVVGLVCGVVGLSRTAGGRRRGRGLAVAGLVVSTVLLLVQAALVVAVGPSVVDGFRDGFEEGFEAGLEDGTDEGAGVPGADAAEPADLPAAPPAGSAPTDGPPAEDEPAGAPADAPPGPEGEVVDVIDLAVGDCFDDPVEETFYEITVLPCDVPHDGEVLTEVQLEGDRYPGATEVDDLAWEACLTAAADLLDPAGVDTTGLDFWTFTPTKESWVLDGDRRVHCLVYSLDGQLSAPVLP